MRTTLPMTELVERMMLNAQQAAASAGRETLTPGDIFRALLDMPDGFHLRVLVDGLELDLDELRRLANGWEPSSNLDQDWKRAVRAAASGEAEASARPCINTTHVLLALLHLWPEAPCSVAILGAAGGSIKDVRSVVAARC